MGSAAFQLSVAFFPVQLKHYAFLVWWTWAVCGVCWAYWLLTAPWMKRHLWCRGTASQPAISPVVRLPSVAGWNKPTHNVQCVGFKVFRNDDFVVATLGFQNAPTGKPLGKFQSPRLRVIYYDHLTGAELADMCPTVWWNDSGDTPTDIGVRAQYALVASFFKQIPKWTASESNEPSEDFDAWHKLNSADLPNGEIRVIAMLSGAHDLRVPPVEGVLTLHGDGNASFIKTSS